MDEVRAFHCQHESTVRDLPCQQGPMVDSLLEICFEKALIASMVLGNLVPSVRWQLRFPGKENHRRYVQRLASNFFRKTVLNQALRFLCFCPDARRQCRQSLLV